MTRPLLLLPVELLVLVGLTLVTTGTAGRTEDGPAEAVPTADPCDLAGAGSTGSRPTDVSGVEVELDRYAVRVHVQLRELDPGSEPAATVYLRTTAGDFEADVRRWDGDPEPQTTLSDVPDLGDLGDLGSECQIIAVPVLDRPCPHLQGEIDDDRGRVDVEVARSCLGSPDWVEVAVVGPGDSEVSYGPRVPVT